MDGFGTAEDGDEFRDSQDPKLYPVGRALRATFDADNHATLSKDVTALMLDLARVPFEPHEFTPLVQSPLPPAWSRLGWVARLLAWRRLRRP